MLNMRGARLVVFSIMMKSSFFLKKHTFIKKKGKSHTLFSTKMAKIEAIYNQNG